MLKLATTLKENNIKFRWTIFTDLNLYGKKPFNLEEVVYMKPSHNFMDYIAEADYGVQLSDTEGYSYFINECLQYGTPVICTSFPSVYESVKDGKNGYILDMNLKNLDIGKIINNIPNNFEYKEKCTEKDWTDFLNKKTERKREDMFKVIAKQNYSDKKPELIEEYIDKEIEYNENGSAKVKEGDVYIINDADRAKEIKDSGLAVVTEIEQKNKEIQKETIKDNKEEKVETDKNTTKPKEEKVEEEKKTTKRIRKQKKNTAK